MAQEHSPTRLAESRNGLASPLYFDRQVIRAEDLTLDRASHAQELARMRRFLHGWGVVAGFELGFEQGAVIVAPGYAVSPLGGEIYLTELLEIEAIADKVARGCEGNLAGCDEVDPQRLAEPVEAQAWIVARPQAWTSDPRPGRPDGCDHPANALSPARLCGGVTIDLVCTLPESHQCRAAQMSALYPYIASFRDCTGRGLGAVLPLPAPIEPAHDYVVLGHVQLQDGEAVVTLCDRRVLLPTEILQLWLTAQAHPNVYYVNMNAQKNGEHEVHRIDCPQGAAPHNQLHLGTYASAIEAVKAARVHYGDDADGCAVCCPSAHTPDGTPPDTAAGDTAPGDPANPTPTVTGFGNFIGIKYGSMEIGRDLIDRSVIGVTDIREPGAINTAGVDVGEVELGRTGFDRGDLTPDDLAAPESDLINPAKRDRSDDG